jgi:phage/plasmid-like protein (TIGR03299 family)
MGHELETLNGRTSMMYVGDVPWHGLGTKLDAPATALETIQAAGLDFNVRLAHITTTDGLSIPGRKAVVRTDTNAVLGVVGSSYVPVQNRQAFGFLDAIAADGGIRYHTAGALRRGERIWLLGKLSGQIRVKGSDDLTEKYLLLSNSHDGSSALRVFFTPIRVCCSNTLAMADRSGKGEGIAIRHQGNLPAKVQEAQEVLGLARRYYDDLEIRIDFLASHHPTAAQLGRYFETLYPDPVEGSNSRAKNVRDSLYNLFERGKGQEIPAIRHSAWAAFNAVTEFVDHHRSTRGRSDHERGSNRLDSAWFGSGNRLKQQAFRLALDMASSNN